MQYLDSWLLVGRCKLDGTWKILKVPREWLRNSTHVCSLSVYLLCLCLSALSLSLLCLFACLSVCHCLSLCLKTQDLS